MKSLTPDRAYGAVTVIFSDIFGKDGMWRSEPVNDAEWRQLLERVETLAKMNMEVKDGNTGSQCEQSTRTA